MKTTLGFRYLIAAGIISVSFLINPNSYSQQNVSAGYLFSNIDGDTITFNLMSDQTKDYFDVLGGTAEKGLIKIMWENLTSASQVPTGSWGLKEFATTDQKISVMWADFLTNVPYVIKSGKLSVTENTGGVIKGTLEITASLGGSSVIGDFLKGKKETNLKQGYFEIHY